MIIVNAYTGQYTTRTVDYRQYTLLGNNIKYSAIQISWIQQNIFISISTKAVKSFV